MECESRVSEFLNRLKTSTDDEGVIERPPNSSDEGKELPSPFSFRTHAQQATKGTLQPSRLPLGRQRTNQSIQCWPGRFDLAAQERANQLRQLKCLVAAPLTPLRHNLTNPGRRYQFGWGPTTRRPVPMSASRLRTPSRPIRFPTICATGPDPGRSQKHRAVKAPRTLRLDRN
jgi:hypothetical protein